jgi:hypothetical protein
MGDDASCPRRRSSGCAYNDLQPCTCTCTRSPSYFLITHLHVILTPTIPTIGSRLISSLVRDFAVLVVNRNPSHCPGPRPG